MWGVFNHSDDYPSESDDVLHHCYCVINNIPYDAEGAHTLADAADTSEETYPIADMDKDLNTRNIWRQVTTKWFDDYHENFDPNEFPAVDEYIKKHAVLFKELGARQQNRLS